MGIANWRAASLVALGLAAATIGALALVASPRQSHYVVFGLVLCAAGVLLLWTGVTARTVAGAAWFAVVLCTAVGVLCGLLVTRETVCCMFGYHRALGYPWGWLDSHATAETRDQIEAIRAAPGALDNELDVVRLGLDAVFWWHVSVLCVVPAGLIHQAWRRASILVDQVIRQTED